MKKPDLSTLGGQIKHYRQHLFSQDVLADKIGLPKWKLVQIESNRLEPPQELLGKLAEVLGQPLEKFNGQLEPAERASRIIPEINDRLEELRVMHGLSETEMSKMLKMSVQHYYRILQNKANPTYNQLREAKKVFKVTLEYLIDGEKASPLEEVMKMQAKLITLQKELKEHKQTIANIKTILNKLPTEE